jgi:hypothetical protein
MSSMLLLLSAKQSILARRFPNLFLEAAQRFVARFYIVIMPAETTVYYIVVGVGLCAVL